MATTKIFFNNRRPKNKPKAKTYEKSRTVPSESMTIRQMLNRHANGINFDNVKTPFYEEQASFTTQSIHELQKMDLTDKLQYLQELEDKTNLLKAKVQAYKDEQDAKALENEVTETTTTNQTTTTNKTE